MFELAPFDLPAGYGEGVLPLADAKRHLSIEADETEFDDLLNALRDAAVDMVERYCGVYLAERTGVVWTADRLPCPLRLGVRPVTALTSVAYLDADNAEQTIDVDTLRFGVGGELVPVPGQVWPSGIAAGLTVTFDAGYTDANRPSALLHAARAATAYLFANREQIERTGELSGMVPTPVKVMCQGHRLPVI